MGIAERPGGRPGPTRASRRELLLLGVGAFALAVRPVFGRRVLVRRRVPVMGTMAELAVVHDDRPAAQAAIDDALFELQRVERLMTRFDPGSDVGRANRLAARDAVIVAPETAEVLMAALAWAEASAGAFDPCLGRAIEAWDVASRDAPPPPAAFRRLAGRRLYRHLDVGTFGGRPAVRFTSPDVAIDLGGIAKGFGVDRAVAALRARDVRDAIVNVGGDLYALGSAQDGAPWRVGIRNPQAPDRVLTSISVRDTAVATSGTYLQFFERGGRRYHHLLDPDTAAPRTCAMSSLTISAPDCVTADAAGTALFGRAAGPAAAVLARRARDARIVLAI